MLWTIATFILNWGLPNYGFIIWHSLSWKKLCTFPTIRKYRCSGRQKGKMEKCWNVNENLQECRNYIKNYIFIVLFLRIEHVTHDSYFCFYYSQINFNMWLMLKADDSLRLEYEWIEIWVDTQDCKYTSTCPF